jgi:serine/threonine protein kinase
MAQGLFCPNCLTTATDGDKTCTSCGYARPEAGWARDEYLGRTIGGKYQVTEKLGMGGFGVVVRARHVQKGVDLGDVVLKFMHPHLANRKSLRRRFVNEARAARTLSSQHVVKVFDLDFDERGVPYIVMEYLEGELLSAELKRGPLEPQRTIRLALQIAGALHTCHVAGIVHRDLKPSNILLLPGRHDDFIKLIDFGIAHLPDSSLSQTMLGTPKYMPPEQIRQGTLDEGVDIFALGVLVFECLTGRPPIVASGAAEYLVLNLEHPPRRLRELAPHLPEELEGLLDKMMAKERAARPASIADVEARLMAIGVAQGWIAAPAGGKSWASPTDEIPLVDGATGSLTGGTTTPHTPITLGTFTPVVRTGESRRRRRRIITWAGGAALAAVAVVVSVVVSDPDLTRPSTTPASLPVADSAPRPAARAAARSVELDAALRPPDARIADLPGPEAAPPRRVRPRRRRRPAARRPGSAVKRAPRPAPAPDPDDGFEKVPGL